MQKDFYIHSHTIGIIAALCPIIFYIGSEGMVGRFVNRFVPCVQVREPLNSFPCYAVYDLYAITLAVGIGIVSFTMLAIMVYRSVRVRGR